jgi:hypothetical protein
MAVNLPLLDIAPADYGPDEAEMVRYRAEGTARALAMDPPGGGLVRRRLAGNIVATGL